MPPAIETTGAWSPRLRLKKLEGESDEAIRAGAAGRTVAASNWCELGKPDQAIVELAKPNFGMPADIAEVLVQDAMEGVAGTTVTFKTVFESPKSTGAIPRHYEDFRIAQRGSR